MRENGQDTHRLSASQSRFWQGQQLNPHLPLYNMSWRFDLLQDIDASVFQRALAQVVAQHDALRLTFKQVGEQPVQSLHPDALDTMQLNDFSDDEEPEETLQHHLKSWVSDPFDLAKGTLRNHLVKLSQDHWVWVLCQHHIACDAHSDALVFKAVSERYEAIKSGKSTVNDASPSFLASTAVQANIDAKDFAPRRSAPTAPYGASSAGSGVSKRVPLDVDPSVYTQIEASIAQPDFRLFTPDLSRLALFLTAYLAFLHRITGDEEITLGLPSHNRLNASDRDTIGLFVEVLPFEVHITPADTLLELHAKVKQELGRFLRGAKPGAIAQQDTRAVSAVLNFIQARFEDFAGHPARVEWLHSGAHDSEMPLRLHVTDFANNGLPKFAMDVADEVLIKVSAAQITEHFGAFLQALLGGDTAQTAVNAVPLTQSNTHLAVARGPRERAKAQATILDLIAAQTKQTPDAPALRGDAKVMSYRALSEESDAIAAHILKLGIAAGSAIALHLPRSYGCVSAMLGVMKAGCVFVPIATGTPYGRTEQILKGCSAAAIIVSPDITFDFSCKRIALQDITSREAGILPDIAPNDPAYILFTSGSTGTPKGALVSHQGLSRYIQWAGQDFSKAQRSDYAFFSSISFDLTLTSIFTPLTLGGAVVVYPERTTPDLAVLDVFADDAVDVVKLTPSHLSLVCKQGRPVSRIRSLVLGGENLSTQLCRTALLVLSPELELINEYGPTEAVVGAMQHCFDPESDTDASVPIGKPADGMEISIRDSALNLCPMAVTGEIVIAGRLAEGYVNHADTAFAQDPLAPERRIYVTGDLGRMRRDGTLEYLGRADQQIKVGGVRLESAELENAARSCSDVNAVHVSYARKSDTATPASQFCKSCGLPDTYPNASFTSAGYCEICVEFETYKERAQAYFQPEPELEHCIKRAAAKSTGAYDAIMLLSGGKDSTYAAYRLAALTSRVLAVTLDNGYIAEGAKTNIARVTEHLGWDHRYLSTDKMNEIFVDSLKTHSNVCQGCFKAIYTLALRTARAEGIAMIVTGLSRGQFFETRLTPDLFRNAAPTCAQLDDLVSQARKTYHAENDTLSRLMQTDDLKDGRIWEEVEIVDIYRYIDVPVDEIYAFLTSKTAWQRPSDTGRSTNCLINDVGIHLHKAREGFHNYALPYSWDVRMGHKTRAQALEELDDEIDEVRVTTILDEIGFDEPLAPPRELTIYVAGHALDAGSIWSALRANLQREMLPKHLVLLDDMPLTPNGKVDVGKLPAPKAAHLETEDFVAPQTEMEQRLAVILSAALTLPSISATRDFFDLGVNSLSAIDVAIKANEAGIALPATAVFEHRCLRDLALYATGLSAATSRETEDTSLLDLDADDLASITEALL